MSHSKRRFRKTILVTLIVVALVVGAILFRAQTTTAPGTDSLATAGQGQDAPLEEPAKADTESLNLQSVLDRWDANQGGTASVALIDLATGESAGTLSPDDQFFAASIYKLYVAYIGYQKVEDGTYSLNDPYHGDWTRGKCLDEMIRTSHSPCAEKMRQELGIDALDQKLQDYGLKNTSMSAIRTSAADAAIVLARLHQRRDLNNTYAKLMLTSMEKQIYRDALPKGMPKATVYDKVGFRELDEYHDTAIVTFRDGRSLVISVLTSNVGTKGIVALGAAIQATLD